MFVLKGNKGGVAIRFRLFDTKVCVVNCHLNAHQENIERRNQDYKDIAAGITFTNPSGSEATLFDHDYLFWIGDLNYRLFSSDADTRQKLASPEWKQLLDFDQVTHFFFFFLTSFF